MEDLTESGICWDSNGIPGPYEVFDRGSWAKKGTFKV